MPEDPRTDRVGGPRHYAGAEVSAPFVWACPACGAKNTTPFSEGCPACGSGKNAAKHVGVDPIAPPHMKTTMIGRVGSHISSGPIESGNCDQAFVAWMQHAGTDTNALQAFRAGWVARGGSHVVADDRAHPRDLVQLHEPPAPTEGAAGSPAPTPAEPTADRESTAGFPGTARDRTLLAALIFFKDQVLAQRPEEIVTGEWSAEDVDTMIAEVQERLHD